MKIRLTVDFDDVERRTLRKAEGKKGLATRKEIIDWIAKRIEVDLTYEFEAAAEYEAERRMNRR